MINPSELLATIFIIFMVAETFILRKELEDLNLHMWVYASIPLIGITAMVLISWHELGREIAEPLAYNFAAIAMITFFIGAVIAWRRGRK